MRTTRLALGSLAVVASLLVGPSALSQGPMVGPGAILVCANNASSPPGIPAMATVVTATTTALISGVAGQRIFICGWHVTSTQSASTTFQFVYGTQGGPCGSPVALTPAFSVTSTAPSADHSDYATMQTAAGAQLCVVSTGATIAQAIEVYYSQF
jgi:hypothetical protein